MPPGMISNLGARWQHVRVDSRQDSNHTHGPAIIHKWLRRDEAQRPARLRRHCNEVEPIGESRTDVLRGPPAVRGWGLEFVARRLGARTVVQRKDCDHGNQRKCHEEPGFVASRPRPHIGDRNVRVGQDARQSGTAQGRPPLAVGRVPYRSAYGDEAAGLRQGCRKGRSPAKQFDAQLRPALTRHSPFVGSTCSPSPHGLAFNTWPVVRERAKVRPDLAQIRAHLGSARRRPYGESSGSRSVAAMVWLPA